MRACIYSLTQNSNCTQVTSNTYSYSLLQKMKYFSVQVFLLLLLFLLSSKVKLIVLDSSVQDDTSKSVNDQYKQQASISQTTSDSLHIDSKAITTRAIHSEYADAEYSSTAASIADTTTVISGNQQALPQTSHKSFLYQTHQHQRHTNTKQQIQLHSSQQQQHLPVLARKFTILSNSTQRSPLTSTQHRRITIENVNQSNKQRSANVQDSSVSHTSGQQQKQRAGLLDKICIGTTNSLLSLQNNKTDHYQNLVERYKNCTYVTGNLEITWLDKASSQQELDLSFLESIREITGYLLIAHVDVDKIRMPNLQVIRGRDLFKPDNESKEEFALFLKENQLRSLELPNLSEILNGSVGSYNNAHLCHIRTIEWEDILGPGYKSIFVYNNGAQPECPSCDPACLGHCWADSPDMCQKFSKVSCSPACDGRRCFGPTASECCHEYCAGGCTGPAASDCLACKNFYDEGSCSPDCPSMLRYNTNKFMWEPNPNGKFAFGATCMRDCPENMLRDNGACVRVCPLGKRSLNGECVSCGDTCPKNCQGVEVVHSDNIDQLINCTVIDGSLTISDESFNGFSETMQVAGQDANGKVANTTLVVRHHPPMHPSRLDAFKALRLITGYLNIKAKHDDFKNLSYFNNLKLINGTQRTDTFHALIIARTSLESLNLRSLRRVKGKITIEDNPDLCFADTIDWGQIDIKSEDVTVRNNAELSKCRTSASTSCHEQCSRDGCWGFGPDECLSCNNFKLDDRCVVNCSSTELGVLSFEDYQQPRTCRRCHGECRDGCNGPEARHCHACKSVKDGPYCLPECPSHKYNDNGTCADCHKGCGPDGCTGPSNKLGEGGCNSCAKAIIRFQDPLTNSYDIECLNADDPCPDGYYQEYVVGSAQRDNSPLKSSAGRPVCRKCHHRCKRCTGMGTHMTVCDCAKYVAGEQCEDFCPRDYYADETSRQCVKCSPECNGCFGPTEADCISCRVYRIYEDASTIASPNIFYDSQKSPEASAQVGLAPTASFVTVDSLAPNGAIPQRIQRFNCTAQCPPNKPHRISESNMLDPYCSEDPGVDVESPLVVSLGSTSILFTLIISASLMICISIYRCQIEKDKTVKLTMHLSGIDDVEPLTISHLKPNLAPLRSIKETELRKGKILGSGFGGTVYQGFWYPEGQEHRQSRPVAIKVLRDNGESNLNKEFLDEAYIMASVNHPNLVRLLAVCMTPNHLMLVTQLMPLGCLLDYVRKNKHDIGSKNLLEWGKQIARGMAYLEEQRMVHRDLALRNVLLQTPGRALISDFGLAKFLEVDQSEYHSGGGRLPIKWLAPECIRERKFTHKSDVWAFGVTIWELVTFGRRPYEEYETQDVPLAILRGARLQQPSHVSAEVYKVMMACWFYKPDERPNFKQLSDDFVRFARDPPRYLICGSKGIELCKGIVAKTLDVDQSDENNCDDDYDLDESLLNDDATEASPTSLTSQPPLGSAMPDLTPSTHNRINEMFGFNEARPHHHNHDIRTSESSELTGIASSLTTPILKKLGMFNGNQGSRQAVAMDEDIFARTISKHNAHALDLQHHQQQRHSHISQEQNTKTLSSSILAHTDVNNNTTYANDRNSNIRPGYWSVHHTVSTNSLGQRSEQPTDMYDYLLPSPCTNEHSHTFNTFYSGSYDNCETLSVRNPPLSAGLVSNITNEEYFRSRNNYVNQNRAENHHHSQMSTSSDNIPQSLV